MVAMLGVPTLMLIEWVYANCWKPWRKNRKKSIQEIPDSEDLLLKEFHDAGYFTPEELESRPGYQVPGGVVSTAFVKTAKGTGAYVQEVYYPGKVWMQSSKTFPRSYR